MPVPARRAGTTSLTGAIRIISASGPGRMAAVAAPPPGATASRKTGCLASPATGTALPN